MQESRLGLGFYKSIAKWGVYWPWHLELKTSKLSTPPEAGSIDRHSRLRATMRGNAGIAKEKGTLAIR
jgi:hypothetical protein